MRVISGSAKGHRLKSVQGLDTRPTQDRVKESIFNIIMDFVKDSEVLDLFSGTGNLSIEALSRGARAAVMVDNNSSCIKIINQNLNHTKLTHKAKIHKSDVLTIIKQFNRKFDIIFIDPPYNQGKIIPVLNEIYNKGILANNGLIVLERNKKEIILEDIPYKIIKERKFGDTIVSFLN